MKFRDLWLTLLVSLLAFSLSACAGSKAEDEAPTVQEHGLPAYFEDIPADTFFFVGGTEPVPRDLVDKSMSTIDMLRQWSGAFDGGDLAEPNQHGDVEPAMSVANPQDAAGELLDFMLEQMDGELSADGLENIGISGSPRFAAYSVGTVPVMRVELSDESRFTEFLDHVEQTYQNPSTVTEHAGTSFRRYDSPGAGVNVLLRTTADEVIIASPEQRVVDVFLPYFVGAEKPQASLVDDNAFERTAETHGFQRYGTAYVDLERMFAYQTGARQPGGITAKILEAAEFTTAESPECQQDYMRLVQMMPRLVAGFRHYDEQTTDFALGAELDDARARGLAGTVSGVPGYDTAFADRSLVQMGLGVDLGRLMNFLVEQAREVQMQPFQCPALDELNQTASQMVGASGQIPPAVTQLAGFNLLIRNVLLEWKAGSANSGTTLFIPRMLAALRTDQPEAFMFLVSQFFPMAKQLQVKPDGKPVSIPQVQGVYEGIIEPSLLMTQRGLALTVGPEMFEESRQLLDAEQSATAPALITRLNLGAPAKEMLDSIRMIIDRAEADQDARGLTDADIAGARRAVTTIESFIPDGAWAATFAAEFNDFGILFSYRDQGALDFELKDEIEESVDEDFDALEQVLGMDSPLVPQTPPSQPSQPSQPTQEM